MEAGTAVRISTGAVVPAGADAVVPVEGTEEAGERVRVPEVEPGRNVRRAGEDVREGELLLSAGARLGPAELGVAASVGRATLACARAAAGGAGGDRRRAGAARARSSAPGRIYSSNAYALAGQVERTGAELVASLSASDTAAATRAALERALAGADVVCVSGGVSVGAHDHVRRAMEELGVEERFWGVSLGRGSRPGSACTTRHSRSAFRATPCRRW